MRLECLVGNEAGLISNPRPLIGHVARAFTSFVDYCNQEEPEYLFFADRPLFSVVMVNGSRRATLPVDRLYAGASAVSDIKPDLPYCDCEVLLDRTYYLPLGDKSWPDDTLIEFEYMDDDNVTASTGLRPRHVALSRCARRVARRCRIPPTFLPCATRKPRSRSAKAPKPTSKPRSAKRS